MPAPLPSLARCSDDRPPAPAVCPPDAHPRLCAGVRLLQRANCAELADAEFLATAIETVGLVPDFRAKQLYGPAAKHMVDNCAKQTLSTCWKLRVGLWQNPRQLAEAMVHVGTRLRVSTYLEVGVYAAWTCTVISAYLGRIGSPEPFRGYAVDLKSDIMTRGTMWTGQTRQNPRRGERFSAARYYSIFHAARWTGSRGAGGHGGHG